LVYQNALPKGTVLFDTSTPIPWRTSYIILPLVKDDWSNIANKLKFTFYSLDKYVERTTTIDKLNSAEGFIWAAIGETTGGVKFTIKKGSNQLTIYSPYTGISITKIELV